ncbi:apolipoprotein N-acyltransferase [Arsukibacterium sp.]|uniref:apolipoprotein N-acyltransferase n=1 Tax=Arsukibacterium sp. TaxID=1977258 RepID=UPI002FD8F7AB
MITRSLLWQCLCLLIAGLLNTLAFAPYTMWWLPFFSLGLLVYFNQQSHHWRQSALLGFSYGLGWFGLGISWVHVSIDQFGGLPLIASLALMALLVSYLALFPALAAVLSWLLQRQLAGTSLLFAISWLFAEWLRSIMLTGFPWLSLGYSQTQAGLAPIAPLLGETGLSFIIAFSAAALAQLFFRDSATSSSGLHQTAVLRRYVPVLIAGLLLASGPLLRPLHGWQYSADTVAVLLVQGNIKQDLRWKPEQEWPTMLKYLDLTRPHYSDVAIVIWPEAAIPQLEPLAGEYLQNLDSAAFYQDTAVITGILDYHFHSQQAWNNLIVVGKDSAAAQQGHYVYGHQNRFSKHHLLPIGEFVPFENWLRRLAPIFDLPMSSFSRGDYVQPNLLANGYQLLPALCFEIAFPRQIKANFTEKTQLLLTVSNDAWFGDSIGPHQHLQIAQMRALEFGRPLLRATNNGITATINPDGSIRQQAPQFVEAIIKDDINLTTGFTPYSRFGDWPLYGFCLFWLSALLLMQKTNKNG